MTTPNYLTLHVVAVLPWHNLNRDDRGMPKSLFEGGKQRGMLSPQSLKRAARVAYEQATSTGTFRSKSFNHVLVADRAEAFAAERGVELSRADIETAARQAVASLTSAQWAKIGTKASDGSAEGGEDTLTWLTPDERESLAVAVVDVLTAAEAQKDPYDGVIGRDKQTGSLSIAAFGRMFAYRPHLSTDAAVAVSPAVTTHEATFSVDYFTAVDDLKSTYDPDDAGAGHLGSTVQTSGVYYRTVTFDRGQLHRSWSGVGGHDAQDLTRALARALVYGLPKGKKNSSAPYTPPVLVLAEEQTTRMAYAFESPVTAQSDGGYVRPTLEAIAAKRKVATAFDPALFGRATASGTAVIEGSVDLGDGVTTGALDTVLDHVAAWALP